MLFLVAFNFSFCMWNNCRRGSEEVVEEKEEALLVSSSHFFPLSQCDGWETAKRLVK